MINIEQILVGDMANFTYILIDEKSKNCIIVDPSWDLNKIFDYISTNNLKVKYIINTHSHFDHVLGNDQVSEITKAKIIQHQNSPLKKDIEVTDNEIINFGDSEIKIIYTPGHSKDSICLIIDNKAMLTGDTIFVGSCGRLDLPGGDPNEMFDSIYNKLFHLDGEMKILPGHHYGNSKTSYMSKEKKDNFVFQFKNKNEFLEFMAK